LAAKIANRFETGIQTTSDIDWDIAFRGTTKDANGGVVTGTDGEPARTANTGISIVTGTFASITTEESLTFVQDTISDSVMDVLCFLDPAP
tara:strand:- start:15697 stop:15969 length:273 start_codon:yes stop_codon:yes gene_type:complete